jgi:hypothetical protein
MMEVGVNPRLPMGQIYVMKCRWDIVLVVDQGIESTKIQVRLIRFEVTCRGIFDFKQFKANYAIDKFLHVLAVFCEVVERNMSQVDESLADYQEREPNGDYLKACWLTTLFIGVRG